jgi:hypothetical protein
MALGGLVQAAAAEALQVSEEAKAARAEAGMEAAKAPGVVAWAAAAEAWAAAAAAAAWAGKMEARAAMVVATWCRKQKVFGCLFLLLKSKPLRGHRRQPPRRETLAR